MNIKTPRERWVCWVSADGSCLLPILINFSDSSPLWSRLIPPCIKIKIQLCLSPPRPHYNPTGRRTRKNGKVSVSQAHQPPTRLPRGKSTRGWTLLENSGDRKERRLAKDHLGRGCLGRTDHQQVPWTRAGVLQITWFSAGQAWRTG